MREIFGRLFKFVLVLVVILGVAVPLQSRALSASLAVDADSPAMPAAVGFETAEGQGAGAIGQALRGNAMRGMFASDGAAVTMYFEAAFTVSQIGVGVPFRLWIDIDFSDLQEPVALLIIEMPALLRWTLFGFGSEFNRQFWVADASGIAAELAVELDARIVRITPAQAQETVEYILEWFEPITELLAYELEWILGGIFDDVTVRDLTLGFTPGSREANVNIEISIAAEDGLIEFGIGWEGEIEHVEETAPLPNRTNANSFDLLGWILRQL